MRGASVILAMAIGLVTVSAAEGGTPARSLRASDVVTAFNTKTDTAWRQITTATDTVLVLDSIDPVNNPDKRLSMAQFRELTRGCAALADSATAIRLTCKTGPYGPASCQRYTYGVSIELGQKVKLVRAMRALVMVTGKCAVPVMAMPPSTGGR